MATITARDMIRTATALEAYTEGFRGRRMDAVTLCRQVGTWNWAAIGAQLRVEQWTRRRDAVAIKARRSWVVVRLNAADLYDVARVVVNDDRARIVDELTDVYADEIGESVYRLFH